MDRFDKKTMSIHSKEYDDLIKKEIESWSTYKSSEDKISSFSALKNTHPYLTYRKGTVEIELDHIKNLGENISVLELGSADGWLTNEIINLENVKDITSIDISLEKNKDKYSDKAIAVRGDLNKINEIDFDQKYDCIITHGTLHHLVDPKKTIEFCLDKLLKKDGILIINDTWLLHSLQIKINTLFYVLLNRLPRTIIDLNVAEFIKILLYKIPYIIFNKKYAENVFHCHDTSPFESISSAEDYKDIYEMDSINIIYFKKFASLSGLQNSWSKSPLFIKKIIQKLDSFLIEKNIFPGDAHICILKKNNITV